MSKKKKIILITTAIILMIPILVLSVYSVSLYINTVKAGSNEIISEQEPEDIVVEDSVEEVELDIEPIAEIETLKKAQEICDYNVDCFLNQLELGNDTYLVHEVSRYIMPGVNAWSGQNLTYTSTGSKIGDFSLNVDPYILTFEEGWEDLPNEMLQDPYYQNQLNEVENAEFLSEEDLAQIDQEERDLYLGYKEQGLTAVEIAKIYFVREVELDITYMLNLSGLKVTCTNVSPDEIISWMNNAPQYDMTAEDFDTENCSVISPL